MDKGRQGERHTGGQGEGARIYTYKCTRARSARRMEPAEQPVHGEGRAARGGALLRPRGTGSGLKVGIPGKWEKWDTFEKKIFLSLRVCSHSGQNLF